MRLTILGSGTMMPTKTRHPAGYLLEADDTKILLDCGHTTIARLVEMDVNLHDIDTICISHFHTDHFSDCFPLIHARWVDDIQSNPPRKHKPLVILGPKTIKKRYQKWRAIFWPEPKEDYPIQFIENSKLTINKLTISSFPIHHVPWFPSVGYKIESAGKTLVYTGDLGSHQGINFYQAIQTADFLLIEAGSIIPTVNHFTAEQAADLAKRFQIKRVGLTHLRNSHLASITKVAKRSKNIYIIKDGDKFDI